MTWSPEHEQLKKFKLEGDFAKNAFASSSPTAVPADKAFESDVNKRKLKPGSKNLEIEFTKDFKNDMQGSDTITVELDNGQILSFLTVK